MKPSGIGGMAVIEGVMMKNKEEYAVAVRKPNNEIAVEKRTHQDFSDRVKLFKLPIFRGMLAFVDSMVIGIKVLNFSASFFEEEEPAKAKKNGKEAKKTGKKSKGQSKEEDFAIEELSITDHKESEKSDTLLMALAVLVSIVISVSFFMVLPVLISNLFSRWIESTFLLSLLEGILRLAIFIGYILAASLMKDIRRVFMYHGAEHKTINCLENGLELTVENVKWQSKRHKRCGTSFMLLVMLISLVFFVILQPKTLILKIVSRVLLVPAIAGISYEFIRLAGKSESRIVNILSKPGLLMQGLTTREPDEDMIEVAIRSVDAVFDWRSFLATSNEDGKTVLKENSGNTNRQQIKDKTAHKGSLGKKELDDKKELNDKKESYNKTKNQGKSEYASAKTEGIRIAGAVKDEEDDEILKALDKYLDYNDKDNNS